MLPRCSRHFDRPKTVTLLVLTLALYMIYYRVTDVRRMMGGDAMGRAGSATLSFYIAVGCLLLMAPIVIVCVLAFSGEGYLRFQPESFSLRWFSVYFGDTRWRQSLWSSLIIALIACVISTLLGFFAAYAFVRGNFRAKKIALSVLLIPIVVPHVITAIAMYFVTAKFALVGNVILIGFCHAVVTLPIAVLILLSSLQAVDINLERAGLSLGGAAFTSSDVS